ncbi:MAG: hypothetical protein ACLRPR_01040 [Eisenbergiella sp.]
MSRRSLEKRRKNVMPVRKTMPKQVFVRYSDERVRRYSSDFKRAQKGLRCCRADRLKSCRSVLACKAERIRL